MALARDEWLRCWGYADGTPEADAAWAEKQAFEARRASHTIISDRIDAVRSHADGKMYDSKSALFRSYRADGNPQSVQYECVGEHVAQPFQRPKRDKHAAMQAVKRTLDEMGI